MSDGSVWPKARPLCVGKIETASLTAAVASIKSVVLAPIATFRTTFIYRRKRFVSSGLHAMERSQKGIGDVVGIAVGFANSLSARDLLARAIFSESDCHVIPVGRGARKPVASAWGVWKPTPGIARLIAVVRKNCRTPMILASERLIGSRSSESAADCRLDFWLVRENW